MRLLLYTIFWNPPIDQRGHHVSKQWNAIKSDYRKRHPSMRCRVSGAKGEATVHVLSFRRKGWLPYPMILKVERRPNPLHELTYAYKQHPQLLTDRWLMYLTKAHHERLHRLDKWLFPWDQRNRFLWLTSLLYVGSWWLLYLSALGLAVVLVQGVIQ
jgi:hypothetical protein